MSIFRFRISVGDIFRQIGFRLAVAVIPLFIVGSVQASPFFDQTDKVQIKNKAMTKLEVGAKKKIHGLIKRWCREGCVAESGGAQAPQYDFRFDASQLPVFIKYFERYLPREFIVSMPQSTLDKIRKYLPYSVQIKDLRSLSVQTKVNTIYKRSVAGATPPPEDVKPFLIALDEKRFVDNEVKNFAYSFLSEEDIVSDNQDASIAPLLEKLRELGDQNIDPDRILGSNGFQLDLKGCKLGESGELLVGNESVIDGEKKVALQRFDQDTLELWEYQTAVFNSPNFSYVFLSDSAGQIDCDIAVNMVYHLRTGQESENTGTFAQSPVASTVSPPNVRQVDARLLQADSSPFRAVGRLHPVGCTAWIASTSAGTNLVTAGHCCCDDRCEDAEWVGCKRLTDSILQFDVRKESGKDGRLIHPDPRNQYAVTGVGPLDFDGEGCLKIGNDWAVIQVAANKDPVTGADVEPTDSQGSGIPVTLKMPQSDGCGEHGDKPCVTVVGYGANYGDRKRHRTLQGSEAALVDCGVKDKDCLKHEATTAKGSSGGPILAKDSAGNYTAIGVHTDGFRFDCNGPVNAGTSFENKDFSDAVGLE